MLRSIPDSLWAFDCEWIPDVKRGRLIYGLAPDSSEDEVLQFMWDKAGADENNPQPFLKLILSRVVSVAVLSRTVSADGGVILELHSLPKENDPMDECALIERFLNGIGKKQPQLVGFNSHDSDLPILLQRGVVTGVHTPSFSKRPNKPWEGLDYFSRSSEAHLDIRAILASWGKGSPSLHELAVSCGVPGKLGVDGNQVLDLWKAKKFREIVDYNEWDALTTYLVWLRMAHFSGLFNEEEYLNEQSMLKVYLESEIIKGKTHLKVYLDAWIELSSAVSKF